MRTIPLTGAKAAGRVTLVDDEDYDLARQFRWRVCERVADSGRLTGPYAQTSIKHDGRYVDFQLHRLILDTDAPRIDHIDHDGLNNRKSNLRPATSSQNNQNCRSALTSTSQFKGVFWNKQRNKWRAVICSKPLGDFVSEIEAAYTYDAAARKMFGEYAFPNFPEPPTQVMRDQWQAEREARAKIVALETSLKLSAAGRQRMAARQPRSCVCTVCGAKYTTRALQESFYCGSVCSQRAFRRRRREAAGIPEHLPCAFCGATYPPRGGPSIYCSTQCNEKARQRRNRERELEGRLF